MASCRSYAKHLRGPSGNGQPLAETPIGEISPRDVATWHRWLSTPRPHGAGLAPKTADTALSFLSSVCAWARREGWRDGENPCSGQRRSRYQPRTNDVDVAALPEWLAAVHDAEQAAAARWQTPARSILGRAPYVLFRLVLLTGARPGELRTALWVEVNLDRRVVVRPTSKSGAPRRIALNEQACHVLAQWRLLLGTHAELRRCERVFPSLRDPSRALGDYRKAWARVRAAFGDADLVTYDLRRTAARVALEAGSSAGDVAAWLGNTSEVLARCYVAHATHPGAHRAAANASDRYSRHGATKAGCWRKAEGQ